VVIILIFMAPHAQRFLDDRQDTKPEREGEARGPSALERNPVSGSTLSCWPSRFPPAGTSADHPASSPRRSCRPSGSTSTSRQTSTQPEHATGQQGLPIDGRLPNSSNSARPGRRGGLLFGPLEPDQCRAARRRAHCRTSWTGKAHLIPPMVRFGPSTKPSRPPSPVTGYSRPPGRKLSPARFAAAGFFMPARPPRSPHPPLELFPVR
jgi:hypothetical protein